MKSNRASSVDGNRILSESDCAVSFSLALGIMGLHLLCAENMLPPSNSLLDLVSSSDRES